MSDIKCAVLIFASYSGYGVTKKNEYLLHSWRGPHHIQFRLAHEMKQRRLLDTDIIVEIIAGRDISNGPCPPPAIHLDCPTPRKPAMGTNRRVHTPRSNLILAGEWPSVLHAIQVHGPTLTSPLLLYERAFSLSTGNVQFRRSLCDHKIGQRVSLTTSTDAMAGFWSTWHWRFYMEARRWQRGVTARGHCIRGRGFGHTAWEVHHAS